ncbi:MAG: phenylalanine--tRNA ligase subunit beta [Candidatus Saccharibacteria bacterium]|nr:phenylalanine--tRNA ligase subunit beta [Candidatus Saccharibacteria bacterium]
MKVSLNLAQFYAGDVKLRDLPLHELLEKIGRQLGAIEEVTHWGPRFDGIVVAKVVACEKHPDADKLSVCRIDDGGVVKDVERGDDGLVQVVCGAPNVRAGLTVAWLPPKTTVPSTLDKDPFVLEVREIRGQKSNGMLASPAELGINDNHDGILEIDGADVGEDLAKPGTPFKKLYGLDDVVIDIENKMFTHRPDCFGVLGAARELAGITAQQFVSPEWYKEPRKIDLNATDKKLNVTNDIPQLVQRFMCQIVENVTVKPSPVWLQACLTRLGVRPINNIVDWSNYYMLLTGQPTHAFDYDKLVKYSTSPSLGPRQARAGEKLALLNGKTITLTAEDMVIATDKQAVALAGIMGGSETEVDETTKTIVIECATFDMYAVRRSSMRHGLFTDAVTRYTKGQSPLQNDRVLAHLCEDLNDAGAQPTAALYDLASDAVAAYKPVTVSAEFINERLGTELTLKDMAGLLKNVEFAVTLNNELVVQPPFWRNDIDIAEDIVEEVGRLFGYENIAHVLPVRSASPVRKDAYLELKQQLRRQLAALGANEVLTYSFVHGNLLKKVGQHSELAFGLGNALSPDLEYYRLSLTPSLLEKVHANIRSDMVRRDDDNRFALFELGKAHVKGEPDTNEKSLPKEVNALALVFAADSKTAERYYAHAPYYQAKKYLTTLLWDNGVYTELTFEPLEGANLYKNPFIEQMVKPYEPKRSAVLRDRDGLIWGVVGEFTAAVKRELKLPDFCAGFEIDPLIWLLKASQASNYTPMPKFPKIRADITLKVANDVPYQSLFDFVWQQVDSKKPEQTYATLAPVAIYQSEDNTTKNITFRLWLSAYNRTLKIDEINRLLDSVAGDALSKLGASRV